MPRNAGLGEQARELTRWPARRVLSSRSADRDRSRNSREGLAVGGPVSLTARARSPTGIMLDPSLL